MDLTDKINCWNITNNCCDHKNLVECDSFENGLRYSLTDITPKVAIDFAKWLIENRWFNIKDNKYHQTLEYPTAMSDNTYEQNHIKKPEQLFQEFLKDYEYES